MKAFVEGTSPGGPAKKESNKSAAVSNIQKSKNEVINPNDDVSAASVIEQNDPHDGYDHIALNKNYKGVAGSLYEQFGGDNKMSLFVVDSFVKKRYRI